MTNYEWNIVAEAHHSLSERPVLVEDVHQGEWDGGGRHQEVRYGEVSYQDVSGSQEDFVGAESCEEGEVGEGPHDDDQTVDGGECLLHGWRKPNTAGGLVNFILCKFYFNILHCQLHTTIELSLCQ